MLATDAGHRLYRRACRILELVDESRRDVGKPSQSISGSLRIASCTVPPETILPDILARFRRDYPAVRECVTVSDSESAVRAVESGAADLGIVVEAPQGSRLCAKPLAFLDMILVVPPGHRFANRVVHASELDGEPLLVRESGSGCRRWMERALRDLGVASGDLTIAMEMNSADMIRKGVEQGLGIAFLPRPVVADTIAKGRVAAVEVRGITARLPLYLVTDPRRLPSAIVRAFLRSLEMSPASE
jgi:DNA-binding transcriptional LysR family regulator